MLVPLLRLAARLPLSWLQAIGALAGHVVFLTSRGFAEKLTENLARSGLAAGPAELKALRRRVVTETGKGAFEIAAIWFRKPEDTARLMIGTAGWELAEQALARGRGLLFLTPHMGCFEIAALYTAMRLPLTVLYRPPKLKWLEPLMRHGRLGGYGRLAPTSLTGVRQMLKALKKGEAVGLLPDHVPGFGEGVWAPFFGRPAYTMTLAGRLQASTGCVVLMAFARRLPRGKGFIMEFAPVDGDLSGPEGARRLNAALEALIRRHPEQYLWSYNRYKVPAGVAGPEASPS